MKIFLLLILCVFPSFVLAGGTSWQIEITSFERTSPTQANMTFTLLKDSSSFESCKKIDVQFKLSNLSKFQGLVTKESQKQSLDFFERRASQAKPIAMIGSMGHGLKKVGNCTYQSFGLSEQTEYQGRKVIYSFYYPI